jgi:homoserine O-acetyltransferase
MMPRIFRVAALVAVAALPFAAAAHGPNDPPHQKLAIGDFALESGETIKDFELSYVTHGQLNAKKSNAVLMVTAISGNHHRIDFMIGPGKAIDTTKYFVVATDAIGNGLTTSPSNSKSQKGPAFPHFTIRDMVASQKKLLDQLGISHLVAVAGASMGGMQTLQWGVSYPDMMDSLIALTPMARTSAWSVAINEATRNALMADAAYNGGRYEAQPEKGWRIRADVLQVLGTHTPEGLRADFPNPLDIIPWMKKVEDGVIATKFDANDWIWQSWAYDRHNVGDTKPEFGGDYRKALRTVKAKALLMSAPLDLYNPAEEAIEAARLIPDGRYVQIPSLQGHLAAAAGVKPADVEFINATARAFLDDVTDRGRKLE